MNALRTARVCLVLTATVATTLCAGSLCQVLAQSTTAPHALQREPNQQIQRCQKLAIHVNRLKGNKNGPSMADQAYAAGIAKLSRRYGFNPCPGLKAPNV